MSDLVMTGVIDHVHDGDTPVCSVVYVPNGGFRMTAIVNGEPPQERDVTIALADQRIRIADINAPELSTQEGVTAAQFAQTLAKPGDTVTLTSPGPAGSHDNYGRILAHVTLPDGRDWGSVMVQAGHAVPFMVGGQPAHPKAPHATVQDGYEDRARPARRNRDVDEATP